MMNRKGMSLIEIIVALMIVGLIAASFLPSAVNSFSMMNKSRSITKATFESQGNIEDRIDSLRKSSNHGHLDTIETKFTRDGLTEVIEIEGITVRDNDIDETLATFIPIVAPISDPSFPDVDVSIEAVNSWPVTISSNPDQEPTQVNVFGKSNSKLMGNINNKPIDFDSLIYRLVHNWYISDEEYVTGSTIAFPNGFTKHSTMTKENPNLDYVAQLDLTNQLIADSTNKLIVYSITQINTYGRYGEMFSDAILLKDENPVKEVKIELDNSINVASGSISLPTNITITDLTDAGLTISHEWYKSNTDPLSTDFENNQYDKLNINSKTITLLKEYEDRYLVYELIVEGTSFKSEPVKVEEVSEDNLLSTNGYIIKHKYSDTVIDASDKYRLRLRDYANNEYQTWYFEKVEDEDYYYIYRKSDGNRYYLRLNNWYDRNNRIDINHETDYLNPSDHRFHWSIDNENGDYTIMSRYAYAYDYKYNNRYMSNIYNSVKVTTSKDLWKIIENQ